MARCLCGERIWEAQRLRALFHQLHCNSSSFAPSHEQWELELGDVLPLQPARTGRTAASVASEDRTGAVGHA